LSGTYCWPEEINETFEKLEKIEEQLDFRL